MDRDELIAFLAANLKPGLDPVHYADNLEADDNGHFEVRGLHTRDGVPVTGYVAR